jgi:hypothetical protein
MTKEEDAARFGEEILRLLLTGELHNSLEMSHELYYSKYIARGERTEEGNRRWRVTQEGKDLLL